MFRLHKGYLLSTIVLFLVEVYIGAYLHDDYIRPYIGDYLVVILIYCFVKSFFDVNPYRTATGVLLFSYLIEFLQYLKLVKTFGSTKSKAGRHCFRNLIFVG